MLTFSFEITHETLDRICLKTLRQFLTYKPKIIARRAFHTCSDLLGDLVILPLLYPTDQKSKIAAKYTASDGGSKSAQLAHVPDRKQASQADSEPPYEEVY